MGLLGLFSNAFKCKTCGEEISGQYVKDSKGNKYCSENCFNKGLPKCNSCGKHMKKWIEDQKGNKYCSEDCYKTTWPKCKICGKTMKEWKVDQKGNKYCSDACFEEILPRCKVCGKPMRQWLNNIEGEKFCSEECFKTTWPICDNCGKPMNEWTKTEDGQKFCSEECYQSVWPKCAICEAPMKKWFILEDEKFCDKDCLSHINVLKIPKRLKDRVLSVLHEKDQSIGSEDQISELSKIPTEEVSDILFQYAKKGELTKIETDRTTLYKKDDAEFVKHEIEI